MSVVVVRPRKDLLLADLCVALALTCAGVYLFSGYFTAVRFDRERIDIHIQRGQIAVRGLYRYENTSRLPAVLTLGVPFPVDPDHPRPTVFFLYEARENAKVVHPISPIVRKGDVSFRLFFHPGEAKWVGVEYFQPARTRNGRYLLTTTRPWRRPLKHAAYFLRLDPELELVQSNYPLRPAPPGRRKIYFFSRTSFYPDQDWEFAWAEPESLTDRKGEQQ